VRSAKRLAAASLFSEDLQSGREFNGLRVVNPLSRTWPRERKRAEYPSRPPW
jgi:hypothetical protein